MTAGQLAWRRMKLAELAYDTRAFQENYPISLNECFQGTGHSVFTSSNFVVSKEWRAVTPWVSVLGEHPLPERGYVAGIDVGSGTGKDYSVMIILDIETGEQVLEYRTNLTEPDLFARQCVEWINRFNRAYVNPERNNHGILVVKTLLDIYPHPLIHQPRSTGNSRNPVSEVATLADYGTYTSEITKSLMVGRLQTALRHLPDQGIEGELIIHSEVLRLELRSFVELSSGRFGAENGCYDDCVMALAMAEYCRPKAAKKWSSQREQKAAAFRGRTVEVFEAGRALDELVDRYNSGGTGALPIRNQTASDFPGVYW